MPATAVAEEPRVDAPADRGPQTELSINPDGGDFPQHDHDLCGILDPAPGDGDALQKPGAAMGTENEALADSITVPAELDGQRFDVVAAKCFSDYSRGRLQIWIKEGRLRVNGNIRRPRDPVRAGETLDAEFPDHRNVPPDLTGQWPAQAQPLEIIYEDEDLIILNKPPGLVVHPGAGHPDHTLVNALVSYDPALSEIPRAGIVHRLDKDTSGLLVVARTLPAHRQLVAMLAERTVRREYLAVIAATPTAGGVIDAPIGRHPQKRTQMAVSQRGKSARTHFVVEEKFRAHSSVRVRLESGRTHQIRVHLAHRGLPIVGDPVYGGRLGIPVGSSEVLATRLRTFRRQALHATALGLDHPRTGETLQFTVPVPDDHRDLVEKLREDAAIHRPGAGRLSTWAGRT